MFIVTQGFGSPLLVTQGFGQVTVSSSVGPVLVHHGSDGRETYQYTESPQPPRRKRKKKTTPPAVIEVEKQFDPETLTTIIRWRRRKREESEIALLMDAGLL